MAKRIMLLCPTCRTTVPVTGIAPGNPVPCSGCGHTMRMPDPTRARRVQPRKAPVCELALDPAASSDRLERDEAGFVDWQAERARRRARRKTQMAPDGE